MRATQEESETTLWGRGSLWKTRIDAAHRKLEPGRVSDILGVRPLAEWPRGLWLRDARNQK